MTAAVASGALEVRGQTNRSAEDANAALWAEFERRRKEDRLRRQGGRRLSEVQQLLAEVQQERDQGCAAASPSPAHVEPATPAPAASESSSLAQQLAASPGSSIATPSFRSGFGLSRGDSEVQRMLAEVREERRTAAVEVVGQPAFGGAAECPKGERVEASTSTPPRTSQPSRCSSQPTLRRPRDMSPSPKRRMELGSVPRESGGASGEAWACGLRRCDSGVAATSTGFHRDAMGKHRQIAKYPASGWDCRTSCSHVFATESNGPLIRSEAILAWSPEPKGHVCDVRASEALRKLFVQHPCRWDDRTACPKRFDQFLDKMPRCSDTARAKAAAERRAHLGNGEAKGESTDLPASLKAATAKMTAALEAAGLSKAVAQADVADIKPDQVSSAAEGSKSEPEAAASGTGREAAAETPALVAVPLDAASVRARYLANLASTITSRRTSTSAEASAGTASAAQPSE